MMISDGAIKIKCHNCGATRPGAGFDLKVHYRWKNAHGCCIRIFCGICGQVVDVTQLYKNGDAIHKEYIGNFGRAEDLPF